MPLSSLLLGLLSLVGVAHSYANPGPCSGTCTNTHDPSIIRRDQDWTYFRFSTGGGVAIHSAPDITGPWAYKGAILPRGSKIDLPGNRDLWAPDVSKMGSSYYLYYSVSTFGSQNSAIGLATSASLDAGSWTDHGSAGVTSAKGQRYNAIDPSLAQASDGTFLLTFGSFWNDLYQMAMKDPPTSPAAGASAYNVAFQPRGAHAVEGATLFFSEDTGFYYLFYSAGTCCGYDRTRPAPGDEYKIRVCRSETATGGFVDKSGVACTNGGGTVVLESHGNVYGPGGQGVYQDPTHGAVLYYHYVDTRIGYADGQKQFGWNKITWSGGWPAV